MEAVVHPQQRLHDWKVESLGPLAQDSRKLAVYESSPIRPVFPGALGPWIFKKNMEAEGCRPLSSKMTMLDTIAGLLTDDGSARGKGCWFCARQRVGCRGALKGLHVKLSEMLSDTVAGLLMFVENSKSRVGQPQRYVHQWGLNREGYVTREGNQGEESDWVIPILSSKVKLLIASGQARKGRTAKTGSCLPVLSPKVKSAIDSERWWAALSTEFLGNQYR
ncbi:hypothetical protein JOM56_010160 [Amanita muscaria]